MIDVFCKVCDEKLPKHLITCPFYVEGFKPQMELLQTFKHTTSSKKPRFALIPYNALVALSERFALGLEKYKDKAWDSLSQTQEALKDEDWILARAEHVIHHAYQYIGKMKGLIPDDGDDDAAAIMWGGVCLSEARRLKEQKKK